METTRISVGNDYIYESKRVTVIERLKATFGRTEMIRIKYYDDGEIKLVSRRRFAESATIAPKNIT